MIVLLVAPNIRYSKAFHSERISIIRCSEAWHNFIFNVGHATFEQSQRNLSSRTLTEISTCCFSDNRGPNSHVIPIYPQGIF